MSPFPKPNPRTSPLAPWLPALQTHLSNPSNTSFTLSTVSLPAPNQNQPNPIPSTASPTPRARTVEFRGFFPTLTLHSSATTALREQNIGLNPDIYESEMLAITTDKRMEKVRELESGSFRNPPPGTPRSQAPNNPALKLGQKVDDLLDPVARDNFRVVVIRPEEVERLDLRDLENVTRTRWTFLPAKKENGEGDGGAWEGSWEEVDLWP
ncbi:hypothetical protein BO70DRAFT_354360 [Aspergillus heteromorphus CBS 117.55]|uniref:Pyridoxamine 5'-phosphate oxidase Alr4036 family FMN-binding domain-containing protein n=1 Tax=Aspergillus heteromorphus CBS 117.55 TaxID=1448321 RepID=A0A317VQW5_9EURO|nr:uncharacterized protein BO70DRAFT_354360 [Aspergillus heteromorphus CBS 117.55]PWY75417.1 hypothetical protein BO70DRAFT_354360 [Aspergillus heteromorphus CBS 117.55]